MGEIIGNIHIGIPEEGGEGYGLCSCIYGAEDHGVGTGFRKVGANQHDVDGVFAADQRTVGGDIFCYRAYQRIGVGLLPAQFAEQGLHINGDGYHNSKNDCQNCAEKAQQGALPGNGRFLTGIAQEKSSFGRMIALLGYYTPEKGKKLVPQLPVFFSIL